jgi:hypothetical protein
MAKVANAQRSVRAERLLQLAGSIVDIVAREYAFQRLARGAPPKGGSGLWVPSQATSTTCFRAGFISSEKLRNGLPLLRPTHRESLPKFTLTFADGLSLRGHPRRFAHIILLGP